MIIDPDILEELIECNDDLNLEFNAPSSNEKVIELLYQIDQFQKIIEAQARKLFEHKESDWKLRNISLKNSEMVRGCYTQPYTEVEVFEVTFGEYVYNYDVRQYCWNDQKIILPFEFLLSENVVEDVDKFNKAREISFDNWFKERKEYEKKRDIENKLYWQKRDKEEKENKDKSEYERLKKKYEGEK